MPTTGLKIMKIVRIEYKSGQIEFANIKLSEFTKALESLISENTLVSYSILD